MAIAERTGMCGGQPPAPDAELLEQQQELLLGQEQHAERQSAYCTILAFAPCT